MRFLPDHQPLRSERASRGHAFLEVLVARGRGRIKSPSDLLLPGPLVLDRVVDVLGHEAVATAAEAEDLPAGDVLDNFILAAIFDDLVLEGGVEGSLTPAELAQPVVARRVESEQDLLRHIQGHALLLPGIEAVIAELTLVQRRPRHPCIDVAELACPRAHLLSGNHLADAVRRSVVTGNCRRPIRHRCRLTGRAGAHLLCMPASGWTTVYPMDGSTGKSARRRRVANSGQKASRGRAPFLPGVHPLIRQRTDFQQRSRETSIRPSSALRAR